MYITIRKGDFVLNGTEYSYKYEMNTKNKFKKKLTVFKPKKFIVKTTEGMRVFPFYPHFRKCGRLVELNSDIPEDMNDIYDNIIHNINRIAAY